MTDATWARVRRIYETVVGYDPDLEGWTQAEALDCLRWMRCAQRRHPTDPSAYTGPTLTSAQLRALQARYNVTLTKGE